MFEKIQRAFWKALTPDLVPDQATTPLPSAEVALQPEIVAALGGEANLKSQQRVALTRLRVALNDSTRIDQPALRAAGVAGVMILAGGVTHLLLGLD
ncbi:PTS transporter subunit EIIB [Pseudomonas gingeri]|uniref:PTS transporter subunit EIIB n=1 Tax=Pseudomonas gingeri TaxID=117681 RepID=A0A7Y7XE88_9PSED|nr:PTS transporter subunit EIIB [Pseudomonas gingeri]NWA26992.1 PTS transporter subunit EIIB [Pseudomonas gingeri]NWB98079.1 PTS transporter subunit EIIB [Pseudomonas gingeri]